MTRGWGVWRRQSWEHEELWKALQRSVFMDFIERGNTQGGGVGRGKAGNNELSLGPWRVR